MNQRELQYHSPALEGDRKLQGHRCDPQTETSEQAGRQRAPDMTHPATGHNRDTPTSFPDGTVAHPTLEGASSQLSQRAHPNSTSPLQPHSHWGKGLAPREREQAWLREARLA